RKHIAIPEAPSADLPVATPRQRYQEWLADARGQEFDFPIYYGSLAITFLLGLSFSIVSPLILPFAACFFGASYVIMKYQFLYVYSVRRDTGGSWWPQVFNLLAIGIGFFQVLTLAVIFVANTATADSGTADTAVRELYVAGGTSVAVSAASANVAARHQRQWVLVAPLPLLTFGLWALVRTVLAPLATPEAAEYGASAALGRPPTGDAGSDGTVFSYIRRRLRRGSKGGGEDSPSTSLKAGDAIEREAAVVTEMWHSLFDAAADPDDEGGVDVGDAEKSATLTASAAKKPAARELDRFDLVDYVTNPVLVK
ncbi:hypothetical protein HK405_000496, partial [Cladochytrium tenue]